MERGEKAAAGLVLVLVLLPLLGFLPQVLFGRDEVPTTPPPPHLNLLLVTAGTWPLAGTEPAIDDPALATHLDSFSSVLATYSPSHLPQAAAGSLLTARWPHASGLGTADGRLAPGTWTLASALADKGHHTAAYLARPLASAAGLEGFAVLEEQPGLGPAELVERVLAAWDEAGERASFVWVHLDHAGPGGRAVGELLGLLERHEDGLTVARRSESVVLVTALASDGGYAQEDDSGFRVPSLLALPADLLAGTRSRAVVSLTDLLMVVAGAARLSLPPHGQAVSEQVVASFQGVETSSWLLLQGPKGHVVRHESNRMTAPGPIPADPELVRFWRAESPTHDRGFEPVEPGDSSQLYRDILVKKFGVSQLE